MVASKPPGILVERPVSQETSLSGLVMFALNAKWNRYFSELFEKKRVRKAYWAIVKGDWDGQITKIDTNKGTVSPGRFRCHPTEVKPAITTFRKVDSTDGYSWIKALPKKGRTHQIRLHSLEAGYPIVGDRFYSSGSHNPLFLHAQSLDFGLPSGARRLSLTADPPASWKPWLELFETRKNS